MSEFCRPNRRFHSGFIPVCSAFCLLMILNQVHAGVITAPSAVTSAELRCENISSPELQGWNLASSAMVKPNRNCLIVDLGALDSNFGKRVSGLRWIVDVPCQRFLLDTSTSSSAGVRRTSTVVLLLSVCEFSLTLPCIENWIRAMKLGSLLAVPPEEMLKPPRK